ncbi:MAG: hypothetical protein R2771_01760 [Saprospiraceae bacterium]
MIQIIRKVKQEKKFRRRAAIEPVIGHLKTQFRMGQNYLWRKFFKNKCNVSSSRIDFKKMMEKLLKKDFLGSIGF